MTEAYLGLIPLFLMAVVGGYIAYRNHKDGTEIGVTLRRKNKK